jgi:hypothetical protein
MTTTLKSIVSCEILRLMKSFLKTCFERAFLNFCHIRRNIYNHMHNVLIKLVEDDL